MQIKLTERAVSVLQTHIQHGKFEFIRTSVLLLGLILE
jgi:hypothetical protein